MKINILLLSLFATFIGFSALAQQSTSDYFTDCQVKGSTTIYDYNRQIWLYTDSADAVRTTLPASTFKVLNSLIALETKVIQDENEVIAWDGTDHQLFGRSFPLWNQDTNLKTAFKNSTIWFYVDLAEKIGRKEYRKILRAVNYGNHNLSEKGTDFWNYGAFEVSPKNQIELLVKLYDSQLPFAQRNMDIVKNTMVSEQQDSMVFRDKTGWTSKAGQNIGWWIGYVTTADNVIFFATRITDAVANANPNFASCRKTITKRILADYLNTHK